MEMRTPACRGTPVNADKVNWLPRANRFAISLGRSCRDDAPHRAEISGWPNRAKASSSASTQTPTSMVFDTRQDSTFLVAQSVTATKWKKATPQGDAGQVGAPNLVRPVNHLLTAQTKRFRQVRHRRARALVDRHQPHDGHETPHPAANPPGFGELAADLMAVAPEMPGHLARAIPRRLSIGIERGPPIGVQKGPLWWLGSARPVGPAP